MKYIYYIIFIIFVVACSYKVGSFKKDISDPLYGIKALYYMGTNGLVIEVSSKDSFKNITIKDNFKNSFELAKKENSNNFCFANDQYLELCLGNNIAILTKNSQNSQKLVLMTVEK